MKKRSAQILVITLSLMLVAIAFFMPVARKAVCSGGLIASPQRVYFLPAYLTSHSADPQSGVLICAGFGIEDVYYPVDLAVVLALGITGYGFLGQRKKCND